MDRRELIQLCTAIVGGLGIPGMFAGFTRAAPADDTSALDESYIAKGLAAMARSDGWFAAHWGAAVIAGYYLCKENNLGSETVAGIKRQLDAMIRTKPAQFAPFPAKPVDGELIETIPVALAPAVEGGLRAHGHAVIFASLSVKALREATHLAHPMLIDRLCGLSRQIARKKPEKPKGESTYASTQAMIEATFDSLVRFNSVLGRPSVRRPNFTHMTTHTAALVDLSEMGYSDVARVGYAGHRAHIGAPVPEFDPADHPVVEDPATLEGAMSKDYWENKENLILAPSSRRRTIGNWQRRSGKNIIWQEYKRFSSIEQIPAPHNAESRRSDGPQILICFIYVCLRFFLFPNTPLILPLSLNSSFALFHM